MIVFTDVELNDAQKMEVVFDWVQNIVGKGESTGY